MLKLRLSRTSKLVPLLWLTDQALSKSKQLNDDTYAVGTDIENACVYLFNANAASTSVAVYVILLSAFYLATVLIPGNAVVILLMMYPRRV